MSKSKSKNINFRTYILFLLLGIISCTKNIQDSTLETGNISNKALTAESMEIQEKNGYLKKRKNYPLTELPETYLSGPKLDSKSIEKKNALVLYFWASWCTPCLTSLPYFDELRKKWHSEEVEIIAINVEDNEQSRSTFLKKVNLSMPIYADTDGKYSDTFALIAVPTLIILNKDHEIIFSAHSTTDAEKNKIVKIISNINL